MKLYHAITNYHLLSFMVERCKENYSEDAILLIHPAIEEKNPNYRSLIKKGFFKEIIIIPYNKMRYNEHNFEKIYDKIINDEINIDLKKFSEINVAGAQYYFSNYLIRNNIKFNFYEEASGMLSTSSILENIVKNINENQYKFALEHNMFTGDNICVERKICNLNAQIEGFHDDKAEHFDVVEELLKLSNEKQKSIIEFFAPINNIDIPKNAVLILTQHFANLKILSFEEQILIYQIFVDYFFSNEALVFKPHPDDIMYYSYLFSNAKVIREKFPSEFLPIIFNNKPKEIATVSSTAVNNLSNCFKNIFTMDFSYERHFHFTHKYYIAIKLLQQLSCNKINLIGSDKVLVEKLLEHSDIICQECEIIIDDLNKSYNFSIIDDLSNNHLSNEKVIEFLEELSDEKCVIFINSKHNFCFYDINHKYIWDNILPISINKKALRNEEFYDNTEEEVIYVYTKNKEYRKMIKDLKYEKKLENTGLEISIAQLTSDQRRIKVLEGILEATEKRLLYYINLEKNDKNKHERE